MIINHQKNLNNKWRLIVYLIRLLLSLFRINKISEVELCSSLFHYNSHNNNNFKLNNHNNKNKI